MAAVNSVTAMLLCGRTGLAERDRVLADTAAGLARRLRWELRLILVGGRDDDADHLPAAEVFLVEALQEGGDPGAQVRLLASLIAAGGVAILPATREGNEIAARTAARAGAGLAANASAVDGSPGAPLMVERPVYANRATATVAIREGLPAVVTLVEGGPQEAGKPAAKTARAEGAAPRRVQLERPPRGFRVVRRWLPGPWEMDIGEAEVVVAGGQGVASREDFQLLAELARLLGGAVAASRPVVDSGLVPPSRQVGLSGRTVAPRLYVACGISGSPHHLVGMRGSGSVITINRDPHAPIHEVADVRLIGEAKELLPPLIAHVRSHTAARRAALEELAAVTP